MFLGEIYTLLCLTLCSSISIIIILKLNLSGSFSAFSLGILLVVPFTSIEESCCKFVSRVNKTFLFVKLSIERLLSWFKFEFAFVIYLLIINSTQFLFACFLGFELCTSPLFLVVSCGSRPIIIIFLINFFLGKKIERCCLINKGIY